MRGLIQTGMIFADGTNVLIELIKVLGISMRAERAPEEAINLACQCMVKHFSVIASK
jgi:hypothetical protein